MQFVSLLAYVTNRTMILHILNDVVVFFLIKKITINQYLFFLAKTCIEIWCNSYDTILSLKKELIHGAHIPVRGAREDSSCCIYNFSFFRVVMNNQRRGNKCSLINKRKKINAH